MDDHGSGMREGADPWFGPEHRMLRDQVRRFVEEEIKPHADAWEEAGLRAARRAAPHGRARLLRHPLSGRVWRLGDGRARDRRPRRGARPLDLWRRRHHGARPHRHGLRARLQRRHRGAARALDAGHHRRRGDHRGRGDRAGRRLRREGHPHHGAARGRRLRPQRHEALHHQRRPRRSRTASRRRPAASAPRAAAVTMFLVEKGTPGFQRRARARQARLALVRHGGAASSTSAAIPAENVLGEEGRGFYAIMRNFQNERLVDRRHGDRRGAGGDRADARLGARAPGLRRDALGQAGDPAEARDARRRRSRPAGSSSMRRRGARPAATTASARSRWRRPIAASSSTR